MLFKGKAMIFLYYVGCAYLMISFFAMFVILFLNIEGGDVKDQMPLWWAFFWFLIFF
jgi:hypothetical protein